MKKEFSSVLLFLFFLLFYLDVAAKPEVGIPKADSLIALSEQAPDVEEKLMYWIEIITVLISYSRWDLTEVYAIRLTEEATRVGDHRKVIFGLLQQALVHSSKADYKKAIDYLEKAYSHGKEYNVKNYLGHVYGNLGSVYYILEDYERSLDNHLKAFDLVKADSSYYLMSYVSLSIGDLYLKLDQDDKGLLKYYEALSYAKKSGDSHKISSNAAAIATFFTHRNELDSALIYIQHGWEQLGNLRSEETRFNLHRAEYEWHFKKEEYEKALAKELMVRAIVDEIHLEDEDYIHNLNMAKVYEKLGKLDLAIDYSNLALKEAMKMGGKQKIADCYKILGTAHERKGDYQKAYLSQKEQQILKDSIHNEKLIRRFETMEVNNATTKQKLEDQLLIEKEAARNQRLVWLLILLGIIASLIAAGGIAFYRLNNRNLQTSERLSAANNLLQIKTSELKKSNENLKHFSFSLSHDILHQLDKIISLTGVQKQYIKENNVKCAEDYLDKTQETSSSLKAFCLDLITYFRLSQHNETLEEVNLNEVFTNAFDNIDENAKQHLSLDKEELPTVIANEKQMYRVFQNLLSNAIKFKQEERPLHLKLTTKETNDNFILKFSDNGKGIAANKLESIFLPFVRVDASVEGSGLGLPICKKIIENLSGEIWVESQEGEGATFFIVLPK